MDASDDDFSVLRRRRDVEDLVADAVLAKACLGGTDNAIRWFTEALVMATARESVGDLLVSAIRYRLAHLLMRKACTRGDLLAVDKHLLKITRLGELPLGPAPLLLRIAVHERLARLARDDEERKVHLRERDLAFAGACKSAQRLQDQRIRKGSDETLSAPMHGIAVNVLEFACYCTGADYQVLDGLRDSKSIGFLTDLSERSDWVIIGCGLVGERRLTESMALGDLDALAEAAGATLVMCLPVEESTVRPWLRVQSTGRYVPVDARYRRQLRMLAALVYRGGQRGYAEDDQLIATAVGWDAGPANLTKALFNVRKLLETETRVPGEVAIVREDKRAWLSPEIRLLAAVQWRVLEEPAPALERRPGRSGTAEE